MAMPIRSVGRHGPQTGRGREAVRTDRVLGAAGGSADTVRQMFRHDTLYLIGTVLPLAVSAAIVPIVTRTMSVRAYGVVTLAVTVSQIIWMVVCAGAHVTVLREAASGDCQRPRCAVGLVTVAVCLCTAVAVVTAHSWSGLIGARGATWEMEAAAVWGGGLAVGYLTLAYLRAKARLCLFLVVAITQSLLGQFLGLGAVVIFSGARSQNYLGGIVVGQMVASTIGLAAVRPTLRWRRTGLKVRAFFAFSLPIIPQQLSSYVLWAGDRVIVQRDLGAAATARYAVAYAVAGVILTTLSQLNQVWMIRVFEAQDSRRPELLRAVQRRIRLVSLPAVFGMALGMPVVLELFAPSGYHTRRLTELAIVILISAFPYSDALSNARRFLGGGRAVQLSVLSTLAAAGNVGLNVVLVPKLGLMGSAVATVIAYEALAGIGEWRLKASEGGDGRNWGWWCAQMLVAIVCVGTSEIPGTWIGNMVRIAGIAAGMIAVAIAVVGVAPRKVHRRGLLA